MSRSLRRVLRAGELHGVTASAPTDRRHDESSEGDLPVFDAVRSRMMGVRAGRRAVDEVTLLAKFVRKMAS
jgi:hypothetical protein